MECPILASVITGAKMSIYFAEGSDLESGMTPRWFFLDFIQ